MKQKNQFLPLFLAALLLLGTCSSQPAAAETPAATEVPAGEYAPAAATEAPEAASVEEITFPDAEVPPEETAPAEKNVTVVDAIPIPEEEDGTSGEGSGILWEPYVPETLDRAIIDTDNRTDVTLPFLYPFSAIGRIYAWAPCGCNWAGTGFMIGPHCMATAARTLVCIEHSTIVDKLNVWYGLKADGSYSYMYDGDVYAWAASTFPEGYNQDTIWLDYGFVYFQSEAVGNRTGWFGMHAASDEELNSGWFFAAGYEDWTLKCDSGNVFTDGTQLLRHQIDTWCGSPLFDSDGYAVGINICYYFDSDSTNCVKRLTSDIVCGMADSDWLK